MSDDIPAVDVAAVAEDGRGPLAIVVTLEGWLELERRVQALEAGAEATVPARIVKRLDRHRSDIEGIKGRWNDLVDYLEHEKGPATDGPTPTLESYQ